LIETVVVSPEEFARLRSRALSLYTWAGALCVVGIFALVAYSIRLGPLVGPGVESSFGLAVAIMFLLGALLVHLADRVYREWPFGRKVKTDFPGPLTEGSIASFLRVIIIVAAGGAVAYVFWGLLTG
jgi:hypothetical protein